MQLLKRVGGAALIAALLIVMAGGAKRASAIPAFANRLNVPCSTCHEPMFPRLNRTGWEFRQLGYRTRAEMNTLVGQHPPASEAGDGTGKAAYGVPVSIEVRTAIDSIQRTGYQKFTDGYVKSVSVYIAGPANKNFGYWGEAQFPQQAPTADSASHTYSLVGPNTVGGGATMNPWLRYYSGTPGDFYYARAGNVSIDGFEGNNSSLMAATSASSLTSGVNGSFLSGRGAEVGFNHKDDAVAAYVIEPSGDGFQKNQPSEVLQYLHFIGKHSSSVQALYVNGTVPTDNAGDGWNKFSTVLVYANYRELIKQGGAFNLLGGYSSGQNHNTVVANGVTVAGSSLTTKGYFGELDYEHSSKFVPYIRYDSLNTGPYTSAGKAKNGNANAYIIGTAVMLDQDARLNLDFNRANSASSGIINTCRAQLLFIF